MGYGPAEAGWIQAVSSAAIGISINGSVTLSPALTLTGAARLKLAPERFSALSEDGAGAPSVERGAKGAGLAGSFSAKAS